MTSVLFGTFWLMCNVSDRLALVAERATAFELRTSRDA